MTQQPYIPFLAKIAEEDVTRVTEKDRVYNGSWMKRGGTSAFHNVFRKVDRLEHLCSLSGFDIFKAIEEDDSGADTGETMLDTIRDLRGYLLLVEAEVLRRQNSVILSNNPHLIPSISPASLSEHFSMEPPLSRRHVQGLSEKGASTFTKNSPLSDADIQLQMRRERFADSGVAGDPEAAAIREIELSQSFAEQVQPA